MHGHKTEEEYYACDARLERQAQELGEKSVRIRDLEAEVGRLGGALKAIAEHAGGGFSYTATANANTDMRNIAREALGWEVCRDPSSDPKPGGKWVNEHKPLPEPRKETPSEDCG